MQVFLINATQFPQRRQVALGEQVKVPHKYLHCWIEAIALLELDRQALGEVARADPGWVQCLKNAEHRFDPSHRCAELGGNIAELAHEIAGLVDEIDQISP